MQSTQSASLDSHNFCVFDCCFIQQFHSTTPLAKLTRNPEKSLVPTLCDIVTLLCALWIIFCYFRGVHNILDLLSWDQEELNAVPAQQVSSLDDNGQGLYLRTNQVKQMCGLITYMKHVFGAYNSDIDPRDDPFHPFTPDEWSQQTSTMLRTYLIQNLPDPHGPEPVPSGPISSSRPTGYSPAAIELMGFKKGIKREIAAYPSLKDERYFDGFKKSLFIVAKTHECNEVLDPTYTPGSEPEEQELFEGK